MSGQLLVLPADAPDGPHLRVRIQFADGDPELRFVDQRTFGGLAVEALTADGVPASIAHIARDPLDPDFDDAGFAVAIRRRTDRHQASPARPVADLGHRQHLRRRRALARPAALGPADRDADSAAVAAVLAGVRTVMDEALAAGGTSFDSLYVNVNGESGYFDRELAVYGRAGLPCRRCGTPIRRDPFMNRSSFSCPRCQPRPRRARW